MLHPTHLGDWLQTSTILRTRGRLRWLVASRYLIRPTTTTLGESAIKPKQQVCIRGILRWCPVCKAEVAGAFQASLIGGVGVPVAAAEKSRAEPILGYVSSTCTCVRIVVGEARNGGADGVGGAPRRNAKPRLRSGRCWMRWRQCLVAGAAAPKTRTRLFADKGALEANSASLEPLSLALFSVLLVG